MDISAHVPCEPLIVSDMLECSRYSSLSRTQRRTASTGSSRLHSDGPQVTMPEVTGWMASFDLKGRSCSIVNRHISPEHRRGSTKSTAESVEWNPRPDGDHKMRVKDVRSTATTEVQIQSGPPLYASKLEDHDTCTLGLRKDCLSTTSGHSTRSQSPDIGSSLAQSMWSLTTDDDSDASSELPDTTSVSQHDPSPACRATAKILRRSACSRIIKDDARCSRQDRECKPARKVHLTLWESTLTALSKLNLIDRLRNSCSSDALHSQGAPAILTNAPGWDNVGSGYGSLHTSLEVPYGFGAEGSSRQQQQQQKQPTQWPQGWDPTAANGKTITKGDQTLSQGRFPCVRHKWGGGEDDTDTCKTRHPFVSRLRVHHSAQGHVGGPFIYCQKCYTKGFGSTEDAEQHIQACRTQICIHEKCPNYGFEPEPGSACARHTAKPSQRVKWRKLYRLAHDLDLEAEPPETGGGTPRSATPVSGSRPKTIRSPTASLYSATMSRGNSHRSHGARSRATSRAADQPPFSTTSPAQFIQDLGLPAGSPVLSGSPVSPDRPALRLLAVVGQQLEDLAKSMLRAVINGDHVLDPALSGWYDAIMHPSSIRHENDTISGEDVARLALRNRTLRTAVEEYRRLIEVPATRLPTRWFTVRSLTVNALGVTLTEETPSAWALSDLASVSTCQGVSSASHGSASIPIPRPIRHAGRSPVPSLTISNPSLSKFLYEYPDVEQEVAYHAPLSHDQEMLRNFNQSNLQIPLQDSFAGASAYSCSEGSGSGSGTGRVDTGYASGSSPGKDSFDGLPYYSALEEQD